jgi:hypothetical protein
MSVPPVIAEAFCCGVRETMFFVAADEFPVYGRKRFRTENFASSAAAAPGGGPGVLRYYAAFPT